MLAWAVFTVVAILLLTSGAMAIFSTDLVRSVLWLAGMLVTTAIIYVVLHADFLAAVQILLYTGGVVTLMLFAVMLTRRMSSSARVQHGSRFWLWGFGPAFSAAILVGYAIADSVPFGGPPPASTIAGSTQELGALFLTDLVLPFEVLSILLLAAMIGAIALARREGRTTLQTLEREAPAIRELGAPIEGGSK